MTAEKGQALFGGTQVLRTNSGIHVVKNRRISPGLAQTDLAEIWADFALHIGKVKQGEDQKIFGSSSPDKIILNTNKKLDRARQREDQKIFGSSSPDKIILNTNKKLDKPIRFFSDNERTQDTIDDWDPMGLSSIFSDNVTNKDVLETLDNLRDRLR